MAKPSSLHTIFVAIPSYRDPECQWTVRDLYSRATHPERIYVGIAWQFEPETDDHCFLVNTRPAQVRMQMVEAEKTQGMCWARAQAHNLRQGEDFVLQVDSHTRFHDGWDEMLLAEWRRCPGPKAALSAYPARYVPPRTFMPCFTTRIISRGDLAGGWLRPHGEHAQLDKPEPGAHFAGGFIFAPAALFREVPYDPAVDTEGEEVCFSARAWTHGWKPFAPSKCILHHYYHRRSAEIPERAAARRRAALSAHRVARLLGLTEAACGDAEDQVRIAPYGMGMTRTFAQWCDCSGFKKM